jgi:hypothetical protein
MTSKRRKETSPRVSSIAAKYMRVTEEELLARVGTNGAQVAADIRAMAASCLSQDVTAKQG